MAKHDKACATTVGRIHPEVLAYTAGRDAALDEALVVVDCIGTAAHVTMLAGLPLRPPIITASERKRVIRGLVQIIGLARRKRFRIGLSDQDVHLAVERWLTGKLGDLGKKIHTGRSRNDQVAVDLRLFAREQLLDTMDELLALADALLVQARRHQQVPMVGRTHMQPAMPSSVGLWISAYAESLLDDLALLVNAYELNDQCPLGSAASYGVPLLIDRERTAALLGFSRPIHNVLHANNARGKMEAIILSALAHGMLTLSRLAQDLMLYTMPEFGYFSFPAALGTGSSIMPQKNNPDVLELVRAKTSSVIAHAWNTMEIIKGLPGGYNRDLQETKGAFFDGLATTRASLRVMCLLIGGLQVHADRLRNAFTPEVFAADRALELVVGGMPFRDAYQYVKDHLGELRSVTPEDAVARKTHLGAPAGLDLDGVQQRVVAGREYADVERVRHRNVMTELLSD